MLDIQKMLISKNYSKGVNISPKYIVVHETDNESKGANALVHFKYWNTNDNANSSVHFVVDESNIIQLAELNWRCWHVGDNKGYSDITNSNSIGIEICVNADGDYIKARQNTVELVAYLIKITGLGIDRIKRHKDASGKNCPRRINAEGYWDTFLVNVQNVLNGGEIGGITIEQPKPQPQVDPIQKAREFVGSRAKELQEKLIALGYDCGGYGADGKFGKGTYDSLVSFQKDNGLSADGLAGAKTFAKLDELLAIKNKPKTTWEMNINGDIIRRLQHELNVQYGAGLKEDGWCGDSTVSKLPIVRPGARGNITRIIQELLVQNGYNTNGIDGIYGNGTYNAVVALQGANGLSQDGIIGQNTWKALLRK